MNALKPIKLAKLRIIISYLQPLRATIAYTVVEWDFKTI